MKTQKVPQVLFIQHRAKRPQEDSVQKRECPFCLGNEKETPTEIERTTQNGKWKIRVFPNKYPIMPIHEVIVHSPNHSKTLTDLTTPEVVSLLGIYQKRIQFHLQNGSPLLFCNQGKEAGSSISHPHSQLLLIENPTEISFYEPLPIENIIKTQSVFVLYCPTKSIYPYEVAIRHESKSFTSLSQDDLANLSQLLIRAISSLISKLGAHLSYNYYILPTSTFFMRIIPRTTILGAFELATNTYVNPVSAKEWARTLRQAL